MVTAGLLQQQYRSGGAGFHADAHDPHLAHLCPPLRGPAWPARGLAPTARRIGRPPTFHTEDCAVRQSLLSIGRLVTGLRGRMPLWRSARRVGAAEEVSDHGRTGSLD